MAVGQPRSRLARPGLPILAAVVVAGVAAAPSAGAQAPAIKTHMIKVQPDMSRAVHASATKTFGCQPRPIDGSAGPRCYSPAEIQQAYGFTPLIKAGVAGKNRTIVIVDAYQNPYIQSDLAAFDSTFNLPTPKFSIIAPNGLTPFDVNDPTQAGWASEISLDVQWAHATAPDANIVLALAKTSDDLDILNTTQYVIDHNVGDVISQSFGEAETCVDPTLLTEEHAAFEKATRKGITLIASSGDSGASQFDCSGSSAILAASSPASDPDVTGVGGTTLNADDSGNYVGETAWTENLFGCNPPAVAYPTDINCSGGGVSTLYKKPWYQAGIPTGGGRGVPDVAYDAGVNGGVLTHCGVCNEEYGLDPTDPTVFFISGGTSAGSPQWAGLVADADQLGHHRLGLINPAMYGASHTGLYRALFHDITTGNNDVSEINNEGYNAGTGWDAVTGLGSPKATALVPFLAAAG
jgi:subtilase family serine protease